MGLIGKHVFRDVNVGQIDQGSVSVISLYNDLDPQRIPVTRARITNVYVINNAPLDVTHRGTRAKIPSQQPRDLPLSSPATQVGIESPNGKVDDGEVTADITVKWGQKLQEAYA